ncbi:unnamed protein product [Cuscuta campestris]|nr:unnamed protein product [Cuscuta campestris]
MLLLNMGFEILAHVMKMGHYEDRFVHNACVHFLVCCGEFKVAEKVFGEICVRDVVLWNSLINGYVKSGRPCEALRVFRDMRLEGIEPDEITMIGMALACGQLRSLELGMEFHRYVVKEMNFSLRLCNSFLDMYVKCGDIGKAKALFGRMNERTDVTWTTMIVGYAMFGFLQDARKLFDEFPQKGNVVTWNAMIGGYVKANCGKEALALFQEMQAMNIKPDEVTMVCCLSACSQLGALEIGCWIHHFIKIHNLSLNVSLGTALIDMYAKCGNVEKAVQVFHEMTVKNALTWTAMIGALALNGDAHNALSHFRIMVDDVGLAPDDVTFLGVLLACRHGGLVTEGRKVFAEMTSRFKIPPKSKHYSCMVDLLGRSGLLNEAQALITSMPSNADASVWGALFSSCQTHRNIELGEKAALKLLQLDPDDSGIYVQLANMYIEANLWHKAREVRKMISERGLEKTPGCSSIEVNGDIFEFTVRDGLHMQSDKIRECLMQLARQMGHQDCVLNIRLL